MSVKRFKIVGILGGMGGEATLDFFQKILKYTKARKDQDHLRVIIDNNPGIPPRTPAILETGENILPGLVETFRNLVKAGADFIVIPCVSAHYFLSDFRKEVVIPILSLIDEVADELDFRFPELKRLALIATTGTIKGRVFNQKLEERGREILVPSEKHQEELVMGAILGENGVKAGHTDGENKKKIVKAVESLIKKGAQGVIAGCTEIPPVLKEGDISVPLIDTLSVLAKAAIREANCEV